MEAYFPIRTDKKPTRKFFSPVRRAQSRFQRVIERIRTLVNNTFESTEDSGNDVRIFGSLPVTTLPENISTRIIVPDDNSTEMSTAVTLLRLSLMQMELVFYSSRVVRLFW